jgi:transposase
VNQLHGLLLEYGVAVPRGRAALRKALVTFLADERGTPLLRQLLAEQQAELADWDHRLEAVTTRIEQEGVQQPVCQRLQTIPGIGPLTASALWVKLAGQAYQHGRHVAAALGLVPKHEGTGGTVRLGGMSKRGDRYLRSLLIHGARSVITHRREKQDPVSRWVHRLVERRGMNKAVVALANKNARVAFALLARDQEYDATHVCHVA